MVAIIASVVLIAGCGGNNIKEAKQDLPSEHYTAEEIDTAKDIVIKDFESGFLLIVGMHNKRLNKNINNFLLT